jgi:hypothetical protein
LPRLRELLRHEAAPIVLLLVAALCAGLVLANDYGMGTDEYINAKVGWDALRALGSYQGYLDYFTHISLAHHGPSYFMVMAAASRLWTALFPGWHLADGRHFTNYLTFLLAVGCLYVLCRRVVSRKAALLTSLLFLSQPVLLGLGFINQKDTPFMAFFLASLVVGLTAADRLAAVPSGEPASASPPLREAIRRDLERGRRIWRLVSLLCLVLFVAAVLDLFVFEKVLAVAKRTLDLAHEGRSWGPINAAFRLIAEDAWKVPVEPYMRKLEYAFWSYGRIGLFLFAFAIGVLPARRAWPNTLRRFFPGTLRTSLWVAAAGGLMGFLVSIRPLGGFVALLVSLYLIYRLRDRAVGPLLLYWIVAGVVCYITWPYLWSDPLEKLWVSAGLLVDFKTKLVLYQGTLYRSEGLPWHYTPVLITLQMSEPVVPLFLAGLILGVIHMWHRPADRAVTLVVLAWLLVVGIASSMPGAVHFNNFRHILFLLPPIFFFAAIALSALFDRVRNQWVTLVLALALLFPGVRSIVSLHPYEYASFNSFAGGIDGATGIYDTEYWCTSYRETQAYLNEIAPPGAVIYSRHSLWSALPFGRPDLDFTNNPKQLNRASYVLVCKHYPADMLSASGKLIFTEGRGTAIFAEAWETGVLPTPVSEGSSDGGG